MRPRLTQEWEIAAFLRGVELFQQGRYWESHEAWEEIWQQLPSPARLYFQGLIQLAAALHQQQRGIRHGTEKHLRNAFWKLALFPDDTLGVNNLGLKNWIRRMLRRLEAGHPLESITKPPIALERNEALLPQQELRPQSEKG